MWCTRDHAGGMSKMVQIRNVPDMLHRKVKARAAAAGQTLSDYLLAEMERLAALPTGEQMLERIRSVRLQADPLPSRVPNPGSSLSRRDAP